MLRDIASPVIKGFYEVYVRFTLQFRELSNYGSLYLSGD